VDGLLLPVRYCRLMKISASCPAIFRRSLPRTSGPSMTCW
jgi:hypothetical protein